MFAFRWKPGVTEAHKDLALLSIRRFHGQIPGLIEVSVGRNLSPRGGGYELGGVMTFVDEAALEAYNEHPAHQELLSWLAPLIDAIEIDFAS